MNNIIKVNFPRKWYQFLENLIQQHMTSNTFPGVEILFAAHGQIILHSSWGKLEIGENAPDLLPNTLFDVASLTKPIVTATGILMLQERGLLDLSDSVSYFIPEYDTKEKRHITLKHLLTHSSGLPAWANLYEGNPTKEEAWERLMEIPPSAPPDTQMVYSCLGYLILGEVIRRISGQSLANFTKINIFDPLQMGASCFSPHRTIMTSVVAPTQFCPFRNKLLRGIVHDENCYVFDEEGGNAGMFSQAKDIFRFCEMLFNGGILDGTRVLSPQSVRYMLKNHNVPTIGPRGIGWDIKGDGPGYMSCGELFPTGSLGHTGFTGTSLWMKPESQIVVIVLSNRVHISREKNITEMKRFRPRLHDILFASLENL